MGHSVFFCFPDKFVLELDPTNSQSIQKNLYKRRRHNMDLPFRFIKSWWLFNEKKKKKKISFKSLWNNGSSENLKKILKLKNIFINQLPNMPPTYISRLVFDKKNGLLSIQKHRGSKSRMVGGCCFRSLKDKQIFELVFFAIATEEQGKGMGKHLLVFLKEYFKNIKGKYIITCADNNAVRFFSKQGFSTIISAPNVLWAAYVRDYEETTLMECVLNPFINYRHIPVSIIIRHLSFLNNYGKIFTNFGYTKKNFALFRKSSKYISKGEKLEECFSLTPRISESQSVKNFRQNLIDFLSEIKSNTFSKPFLEPVDTKMTGAKDYFTSISNAVDLRSLEEKIRNNQYCFSPEIFYLNIKTVVKNCRSYNGTYHLISENSFQMEKNLTNWKQNYHK